ncbi:MAG: rhomboid family intramembrane serine protease, partial [Antricoccus sp.]
RFLLTTLIVILTSGLAGWALTFPKDNQVIYVVGASGVIIGWLAYLLLRGIFTRNVGQIIISAAVLIAYGTALFAVFPQSANVSWQAHLGGAIGGVLAAWLLRRSGPTGLKPKSSKAPAGLL